MAGPDAISSFVSILSQTDLPIGLYVVEKSGRFRYCNPQACEMMGISEDTYSQHSIIEFYADPAKRDECVRNVEEAENQSQLPPKQIVDFKGAHGCEMYVQNHCRTIRDSQTNLIVGYAGSLVDVTEEERLRRRLPVGVYRLSADGIITFINKSATEKLGFHKSEDIIGKPVRQFYSSIETAQRFEAEVKAKGFAANWKLGLIRTDGETIVTSASAYELTDAKGNYLGREGVLVDVTSEERYRKILNDLPVGTYEVRIVGNMQIIRECNDDFERIFEFDSGAHANETTIKDLYRDDAEWQRFQDLLVERDRQHKAVIGEPVKARTKDGKPIVIEVNCRPIHKGMEIVGRIGAIRDITEEVANREQIEEYTKDFGRIFHDFPPMSRMLREAIRIASPLLGYNPSSLNKVMTAKDAYEAIILPTNRFGSAVSSLFKAAKELRVALSAEELDDCYYQLEILNQPEKEIEQIALIPPTVRLAAEEIVAILDRFSESSSYHEQVSACKELGREVIRLCVLVSLHRASGILLDMGRQVQALEDYITQGVRQKEERNVCSIGELLQQAISELADFAQHEGVLIKSDWQNPSLNAQVLVSKRDVVRALGNLLHNSIKYSWSRTKATSPWSEVHVAVDNDCVRVSFENWGVPIEADEIKNEIIFHIGQRGRLSDDRGRPGTGIGLADARRVAREYGGDVTITSYPASGKNPTDYKQPFLTTAAFTLRLHQRKRG